VIAPPRVLFVCVQNAGRSQMAAALLDRIAQGRVEVRSAGSAPAAAVHPGVVEAMREIGIDLSGATPRTLVPADLERADVVVTMGCGDACPVAPGRRTEDWAIEDPAGKSVEAVRAIRDDLERRVRTLLDEIEAGAPTAAGPGGEAPSTVS